ncbi:MAG TPA: hypothetical protein VM076_12455 [Gemmatimonadaceae bacterium]|nr:hypothetical protein [Gemmatimonadaceae bacterium]
MCAALSLAATLPGSARAQRVLGVGEDATIVAQGTIRVSALAAWSTYNELYGAGGRLEALGGPFSTDSLGAAQFEILRPIQTSLRQLAALPTAKVSLGPARTDMAAHVSRSGVAFDVGLTSRIMLSAKVPYEHTITEAVFNVNARDELTVRPNIGVNPALAPGLAASRNGRVVDSLLRAANELSTRLGACSGTGGDAVCANRQQAEALVTTARTFASGVATTYGTGATTARGSAFVPLEGSALQAAIAGRVAALNASFKAFIPSLAAWDTPTPARVPVSAGNANTLVSEMLGVPPLGVVDRSHLGDIEVGAKVMLFDTFGGMTGARRAGARRGFRVAVGGLVRLGTGQVDRPNELADVGTGDGQTDVEGNAAIDFVLGHKLWASVAGRYGLQMKDEQTIRIPDVSRNPFQAAYREQLVGRDLGDYMELEASPRYVLNDYLSASLTWLYRRKGEDTYTGSFTVTDLSDEQVSLDAGILGLGTEQSEQRVGGGASFSTLRAFDRGRANVPIEVQLLHWQTISGSGYAPKRFSTQVQVRYYTRLFGAPMRAVRAGQGAGT